MAILTGEFTKYSAIGIREDLSNIIYNISPETTPFISNMSNRRDVKNTYFEWQTDVLSAAASNAVLDGDDLGTSFNSVVPTVRLGGYTQISRKDFAIADNLDGAIDEAGRRTEIAYQLAKQGNELKRDQEFNLVGLNNTGVAGNNTTIRETASLSAWIGTNVSHGTNGASPGGGTACTDGTQRAMTEAMLKSVMQLAWTQGGSPNYLLVGPHVKTVVSGFAGIAEQRYMAPSDGPTTIIGAADIYVSDFGAISIVPSRFSRTRDAYLIDKELVTLATLRPMQSQELAKTGDSTKYLLLVEYGLQVNNEKGLGAVYDLSTS